MWGQFLRNASFKKCHNFIKQRKIPRGNNVISWRYPSQFFPCLYNSNWITYSLILTRGKTARAFLFNRNLRNTGLIKDTGTRHESRSTPCNENYRKSLHTTARGWRCYTLFGLRRSISGIEWDSGLRWGCAAVGIVMVGTKGQRIDFFLTWKKCV